MRDLASVVEERETRIETVNSPRGFRYARFAGYSTSVVE